MLAGTRPPLTVMVEDVPMQPPGRQSIQRRPSQPSLMLDSSSRPFGSARTDRRAGVVSHSGAFPQEGVDLAHAPL